MDAHSSIPGLAEASSDGDDLGELAERLHDVQSEPDDDPVDDPLLDLVRNGGGAPKGLSKEEHCAWSLLQEHPLVTKEVKVADSLLAALEFERDQDPQASTTFAPTCSTNG